MLDKANAKIKQEQMQQQQQDPLSLKLKEEPPQQAWSVVKTEAEIKKEPNLTPGPNWTVKTQQVRLFFLLFILLVLHKTHCLDLDLNGKRPGVTYDGNSSSYLIGRS